MLQTTFFIPTINEGIALLSFESPEKTNPLSTEALNELNEILSELENNSSVRAVIFTGKGRVFSAGANISNMSKMTPDEALEYSTIGQTVFNKIENARFITIAAVNGIAVGGGCEFSLSCDFRIASEKARFGQPEINLGLIPGWGGTRRLARYVGQTKALEFMLSGKLLTAEEANQLGLLNSIVKDAELLECATNFAKELLTKSPIMLSFIKTAFRASQVKTDSEAELIERELFAKCFALEDSKEGMTAFLEKREAKFSKNF